VIIGIEARSASHPQAGGYKTYVQSLIAGLAELGTQYTFNIYTDRATSEWAPPAIEQFKTIPVSNHLPLIRHAVREQIQLPQRALSDKCVLMHYTANSGALRSRLPYVVTLHDVISLTVPQAKPGLTWPRLWQWAISAYDRLVIPSVAQHSQAVITVSDYERRQIVNTLGISPDKVLVTHLATSPVFTPLTGSAAEKARLAVQAEYRLAPGYFMAVGYEPRKNISSVIEAYRLLDNSLRQQHGLLVVCARESIRQELKQHIDSLGLSQTVCVIPGVEHHRLTWLYNSAAALIFPSLRESFGLPTLEAMACGTPVVAANTSSLPEVLGDAALLVPPTDIRALADAMLAILTKPGLSGQLSARGLIRSQQFSWRSTAQQTLAAYESL
jgi:glycosyltransferase involved in cell wall biosynthesis